MPEEDSGNSPPRNPDGESLARDPRTDLPEQGVVGKESEAYSDQEKKDSESPSGRVHWINYATFFLSVTLAILTAGTIVVYYLQLQQMITATRATQSAAYDACMSAKIARQTLLEYQAGEVDTHSAASGTVAQASAAIRGESGVLSLNTGRTYMIQPGSPPETPRDWKKLDLTFNYGDIGKSSIKNVRIKFTVQLLPHGTEPEPANKKVYFDTILAGLMNPGELSATKPHFIDKDDKFVNPDDFLEDFHSGKVYVASFGRADYADIFGVSHWQTFCGFYDNYEPDPSHRELLHAKCSAYNRQDSNLLYALPQNSAPTALPSLIEEIVCTPPQK